MKFLSFKRKSGEKKTAKKLGVNKEADLEYLMLECAGHLKKFDENLITKAYHWCCEANKNRLLRSGEPFHTYPLSVAHVLISEIPLDDTSVASALLAGCIHQNGPFSLSDIRSEFSGTITEIVENIITIKKIDPETFSQLENYRKILLSLFKDVRIILIVLADKLHNLRTLEFLPEHKQYAQAKEAMEVYAPFAQRFGLFHLKWEIEDLSFKYINPQAYNEIKHGLKLTRNEREDYLKRFTKPIQDRLSKVELFKKNSISFEITARAKHIYSIFNKMIAREKGMDELYDLFAVRIIIDSDENSYCFLVYGILSELYKPVPGTFKNYISSPKKNGYQSIHTAVFGPQDKPVEIQIRTRKMHEISERGVAAHFDYKRGLLPAQSVLDDKELLEWMNLVRNTFENASGSDDTETILESLKNNLFQDEIYVFTPSKEFRVLPKDSTPLDFAYNIHSEIGNHCIGAKVNARVVPLNYKLKSGDQIEILTSKKQKPSKEWLDFVISHRAKAHIQKYFKDERKIFLEKGKEVWHKLLNYMRLRLPEGEIAEILRELKFEDFESLFVSLGNEELDVTLLYSYLKDKFQGNSTLNPKYIDSFFNSGHNDNFSRKTEIPYQNGSVRHVIGDCCNPLPGDNIAGILNDSGEIVIHNKECRRLEEIRNENKYSVFDLDWPNSLQSDYLVRLRVTAQDDLEIIDKVTHTIITSKEVAIKSFNIDNKESQLEGSVLFRINNLAVLSDIIGRISNIQGIISVERVME